MTTIIVTPNIEKTPWTEMLNLNALPGLHTIVKIGRLPKGTVAGKSTVNIQILTNEGVLVTGQTTMANFQQAARLLKAADANENETQAN